MVYHWLFFCKGHTHAYAHTHTHARTSRADVNCSGVTFFVSSGSNLARMSRMRVSLTMRCSCRTSSGSLGADGSTALLPMSSGVLPDLMTEPYTTSKSGRFLRISSTIARNSYSTGMSCNGGLCCFCVAKRAGKRRMDGLRV